MNIATILLLIAIPIVSLVFGAYYAKFWVKEVFDEIERAGDMVALCIAHLMYQNLPLHRYFMFLRSWRAIVKGPTRNHAVWAMWEALIQDRVKILLKKGYGYDEAYAKASASLDGCLLELADMPKR